MPADKPGKRHINWNTNLASYKAFVAEHGRGDVAYIKRHNKQLSIWVNRFKSALAANAVSAARVAQLASAGITPAQPAARRCKQDVLAGREATLGELAAYIRRHGHACLPPSEDTASLSYRVYKLRAIARQRDPVLLEKLNRLGALKSYPDYAWECGFSAWQEYATRTGDFNCEVAPPALVLDWARGVREQLSLLSMPLPWLSCDRKRLLKPTRARACALAAMGRLSAAGFTKERKLLSETDMVAAKLAKVCSLPAVPVSLRTVLRVLSNRHRVVPLSTPQISALHRAGVVWCTSRQSWRQTYASQSLGGTLMKSSAESKSEAGKRQLARTKLANDPLPYAGTPVVRNNEVKSCVEQILGDLVETTSEAQLIYHPSLASLRNTTSLRRFRQEISFAVYRLHKERKIEYLASPAGGSAYSPFRTTA